MQAGMPERPFPVKQAKPGKAAGKRMALFGSQNYAGGGPVKMEEGGKPPLTLASNIQFIKKLMQAMGTPAIDKATKDVVEHAMRTGNEAVVVGEKSGEKVLPLVPGERHSASYPKEMADLVWSKERPFTDPYFTVHPHPTTVALPSKEDLGGWGFSGMHSGARPMDMWIAPVRRGPDAATLVPGLKKSGNPGYDAATAQSIYKLRELAHRLSPEKAKRQSTLTTDFLTAHGVNPLTGSSLHGDLAWDLHNMMVSDRLARRVPMFMDSSTRISPYHSTTVQEVLDPLVDYLDRKGYNPFSDSGHATGGRIRAEKNMALHGSQYFDDGGNVDRPRPPDPNAPPHINPPRESIDPITALWRMLPPEARRAYRSGAETLVDFLPMQAFPAMAEGSRGLMQGLQQGDLDQGLEGLTSLLAGPLGLIPGAGLVPRAARATRRFADGGRIPHFAGGGAELVRKGMTPAFKALAEYFGGFKRKTMTPEEWAARSRTTMTQDELDWATQVTSPPSFKRNLEALDPFIAGKDQPPFPSDVLLAIADYTGSGYDPLNKDLRRLLSHTAPNRSSAWSEVQRTNPLTTFLQSNEYILPRDIYRSGRMRADQLDDLMSTYSDPLVHGRSLGSFSFSPEIALGFGSTEAKGDKIPFLARIPGGSKVKGANITSHSGIPGELEVLLAPFEGYHATDVNYGTRKNHWAPDGSLERRLLLDLQPVTEFDPRSPQIYAAGGYVPDFTRWNV